MWTAVHKCRHCYCTFWFDRKTAQNTVLYFLVSSPSVVLEVTTKWNLLTGTENR
jgi:hypothetical protein